jgi:hypothetical protein
MYQSFLSAKAEVRTAGAKGVGVFARAPIAAGETVAAFGGSAVHTDEFYALSNARRVHGIQIADDLFMVGPDEPEPADRVNHSCDPNAGIVGNVLLVAMREIGVDEEICFDYAMADSDDYDEFACECGAATCRRTVTGADWKLPELQDRYRGWTSSYLERRIADSH